MLILSECILKRECAILTKEEDVEFWKKLVEESPHNSMRVRFFEADVTKVGGYGGTRVTVTELCKGKLCKRYQECNSYIVKRFSAM